MHYNQVRHALSPVFRIYLSLCLHFLHRSISSFRVILHFLIYCFVWPKICLYCGIICYVFMTMHSLRGNNRISTSWLLQLDLTWLGPDSPLLLAVVQRHECPRHSDSLVVLYTKMCKLDIIQTQMCMLIY